mmetsp:Transcript_62376/g.71650  ORF Transcript_62376/g.71650 Transcript_62376/m.71650 type:complete len:115 (-) Transcript_62376:1322-1666(-)
MRRIVVSLFVFQSYYCVMMNGILACGIFIPIVDVDYWCTSNNNNNDDDDDDGIFYTFFLFFVLQCFDSIVLPVILELIFFNDAGIFNDSDTKATIGFKISCLRCNRCCRRRFLQ